MQYETEGSLEPRVWTELSPDRSVATMFSFCPEINTPKLDTEIIFVLDRSGSMGGSRMGTNGCVLLIVLTLDQWMQEKL